MRTDSLRGLPTVVLASARRWPGRPRRKRLGHEDAADRGAFLAGLDGHLARHFRPAGRGPRRPASAAAAPSSRCRPRCCSAPSAAPPPRGRGSGPRCRPSR
jgi:hypothetical protein